MDQRAILELATYWLIAVNFVAFAAFGFDKAQAEQGGWRVRERTLLTLALLGGTLGAYLGRRLFRHKTRKNAFSNALLRVLALQVILIGLAVVAFATSPGNFAQGLRSLTGNETLFRSDAEIRAIELSVTYTGCNEVRALGLDPVSRGEPGYRTSMDGDGDGQACEPYR